MTNISEDVLRILSAVDISGNNVIITGHLDRKLYLAVNNVLDRIGGKWNRKEKAHIFDGDPTDRINNVIECGVLDPKVKTGYFTTPAHIVDRMIELADIHQGQHILEPSAGQGHIAEKIIPYMGNMPAFLVICESLAENNEILHQKGLGSCGDFFKYSEFCQDNNIRFDRIIMNPPFEKQACIDHVTAAFNLLKPGGILVTIMSAGVLFRANKKTVEFRDNILNPHKTYLEDLPAGTFKESGTMVNTVLLRLEAPREIKL